MKERIGVYICHCGGNISDYVDVEELGEMMKNEDSVVIAKNVMFACADSNQKDMINDIRNNKLDAIVVASCSPKLHLHTFRNVADRAGLNPFNYVQVNIREQCSWAHSDQPEKATLKAAGLIRAGIKRVLHSKALENIEVKTQKSVLVIGAGVAGMRAAIDLARMSNEVFLIEKESKVGGKIAESGELFLSDKKGEEIITRLYSDIKKSDKITLFTRATAESVCGSLGNFNVIISVATKDKIEKINLLVGSVLVTTGFDYYQPKENEYGYNNLEGVITLAEFKKIVESNQEKIIHNDKHVKRVAFIYCVGNRQTKGENKYCSRTCCSSAIHTSIIIKEKYKNIKSFHFFRDIRTYGKQEILYERSSMQGDVYLRYDEKEPPMVDLREGKLVVKVKDYLTSKKEMILETDLVVLVTGMVARADNKEIAEKFKIPVGNDKFFNEIHPKLKPVETVIKGVFIGGSCQGPKNISESVQSSLSASAKINALIKSGTIFLEPIVAMVDANICTWCSKCAEVCEYDALKEIQQEEKSIASVNKASCTGCGICAPVCPVDAIQIAQYTNLEIESMIDGFMEKVIINEKLSDVAVENEDEAKVTMKEFPQFWKELIEAIKEKPKTIPELALELEISKDLLTYHVMTMIKYNLLQPAGMDKKETYHFYKLKN